MLRPSIHSCTVLLAEDDEPLRWLLCDSLERAGHRVVATASGDAAIRALMANKFDVIVTDVLMPDGDGLEVITAARERQPGTPIVAISGGSTLLGADFCLHLAGALSGGRVLYKPFKPQELVDAIEALCTAARGVDV